MEGALSDRGLQRVQEGHRMYRISEVKGIIGLCSAQHLVRKKNDGRRNGIKNEGRHPERCGRNLFEVILALDLDMLRVSTKC